MATRSATLTVVEEVEEPIFVEWEQGGELHTEVIEPGDPGWVLAWLWREKAADLKNAERDLASKRSQLTKLQREKAKADERERNAHPDRDFIEELFEEWRVGIGKSKATKLTPERFDMAAARLNEDYEREHLRMAVWALILNPYLIDGDKKTEWKTALKDGEALEGHANRCPAEKRREIRGQLFDVEAAA